MRNPKHPYRAERRELDRCHRAMVGFQNEVIAIATGDEPLQPSLELLMDYSNAITAYHRAHEALMTARANRQNDLYWNRKGN